MSVDPNNLAGTAKLTFADDFNTLSLWNGSAGTWSTTFWYQDPNGAGSTIATTHEQEWYINANYGPTAAITPWTVSNGALALTAAPASAQTQTAIGGSYAYTSGEVNTYHSFAQTYGYFEIRALLPSGQGFWPAFWLMPENGSSLPELDVMEALSSDPTRLTTTSHSSVSGMLSNNARVTNTTTGYHTYGIDWEPDFITWYFDSKPVYQIATPSDMNQPMYMIVNLAVGGNFAGTADGVSTGQMQVDYVRAYSALSPGGSATTTYNATTDTISTNGNYTMPSNVHNLVLTGAGQTVQANDLGDVITSNNNNNTLIGGAGADTLIAGRGHDTLTGGAGNDTFVYNGFPWDTGLITDFTPYQDQIDLRGMLSSVGYGGSNPVGDGYLALKTDGAGASEVWFDPDGWGPGGAYWIFSLAKVQASALQVTGDFVVAAGSSPNLNYASAGGTTSSPPASGSSSSTSSGAASGGTSSSGSTAASGASASSSSVTVSSASYTAASGVTAIWLSGANQTIQGNNAGDTFYSDNSQNRLMGGSGNDTFYMGRGGDSASSGGGTDTFVFKEAPWASGHIAGFAGQDVLDLQFLQTYGYTGSNPIADGRIKVTPDGAGGAQVWVVLDGLGGAAGTWLVTTLDGVSPSSLAWQSGRLVDPPASSGSTSMSPPSPGPQPALTGVTFTSDNNGDHWTGTSSNDFFNLGRGGDTVTGNGGADTFRFAETPWAGGHITDFGPDDVLDLSPMMARYGYAGSDPGGRITIAPDGAGGAQVWFNMGGLAGASGNWLVTTLDHVSPSSVQVSNGLIRTGAAAAGASTSGAAAAGQTFTSDNSGDHWTGSTGPDTFYVGRGGDVLTGAGGDDTFVFREAPWARAQITDFHAGDQIDLSSMLARYGYQGSDPIGDGHMKIVSDGAGGAQIWFDFDGLPSASGTWQLATLDHFAPSQLHVSGAYITG